MDKKIALITRSHDNSLQIVNGNTNCVWQTELINKNKMRNEGIYK